MISLRSQVDTSQTVQRDFVQLSQSLQVRGSAQLTNVQEDFVLFCVVGLAKTQQHIDILLSSVSLQVKLELIRQAESFDQVKEILGEGADGSSSSGDAS